MVFLKSCRFFLNRLSQSCVTANPARLDVVCTASAIAIQASSSARVPRFIFAILGRKVFIVCRLFWFLRLLLVGVQARIDVEYAVVPASRIAGGGVSTDRLDLGSERQSRRGKRRAGSA